MKICVGIEIKDLLYFRNATNLNLRVWNFSQFKNNLRMSFGKNWGVCKEVDCKKFNYIAIETFDREKAFFYLYVS